MVKTFAAAALLMFAAAPASAVVIYEENFDQYTPALNFAAFDPPGTVSDGTVDVVASGTFSIDCAGGAGNCLDLDGSTGNSGAFSFTLDLEPGDYEFGFDYSGNQRGGAADTLFLEIYVDGVLDFADTFVLNADDPFQSYLTPSFFFGTATNEFRFFTDSNDNVGPVLDNILLERVDVPAPAAAALFGLALIALGVARRR